jgi:hypothetical protein
MIEDSDEEARGFFLFIGSATSDAAVSTLATSRIPYRLKRLESGPKNWETILDLIQDSALKGVVAKLTARNFNAATSTKYADVAPRLFAALGRVRHTVFIHESILSGEEQPPPKRVRPLSVDAFEILDDDDFEPFPYSFDDYFRPPTPEVRAEMLALLEANNINILAYRTNAELSVLSAAFIDENESNLLFRIYVPAGRIYAGEADRLLAMFRDWLMQVKKHRIRQDGYQTGSGRVYELYGEDEVASTDLALQFSDFSRFLDTCIEEPAEAHKNLTVMGVEPARATDIVRRYGKEGQRLSLDIRQERESKLLSIRHRLESELIDDVPASDPAWQEIERLVKALTPGGSAILALNAPPTVGPSVNVTINQQIVDRVQGAVVQEVGGTQRLTDQAQLLLQLIERYAETGADGLRSDVYELEDSEARDKDRLGAKQRLKAFMFRLGGKVEETSLRILQAYVESKIGL